MTFPAEIPVRREPEASANAPSLDVAWGGVLVLLCLLVWAMWSKHRRGMPSGRRGGILRQWMATFGGPVGKRLQVLSTTRLTPRHSLHEVDWQGRRLLVGCTDQSIQLLAEVPIEADSESQHAATFTQETQS